MSDSASDKLFSDLPTLDADTRSRLGIPDVSGGKKVLNLGGDSVKPGDTIDLTTGQAPKYVQPQLVGQKPAPTPATPAPSPTLPVAQPQQAPPAMAQQVTSSYTPGIKLSPEIKAQQADAIDAKESAQLAQNAVEAENAKHTALILQQKNDELAKQQEMDAAEALRIKGEADKAQSNYLGAIEDFKSNSKVDPNKFWKDRGVGVGILAALAQGLGAFGSALTKTPNYAMEIIKGAVDNDIRAQENAIGAKRDAVGLQGNLVQHFRQKGLDQESAARAAKTTILDRALGKIDAMTATSKNEALQARAGDIKAGIMAEKANVATQNYLHEQGKYVRQTVTGPAQGPSVNDQLNMNELKVDVPQSDPKTGKDMGSKTYIARSKTDAEKIRQAMVVREAIKGNLERMGTLVDEKWQSVPLSTGKKQVEALANDLRTQFGVLRGLGALSDKDYTIASQLGDPTAWTQSDSQTHELMGQFQSGIDQMVDAEMRGRGMYR